MHVGPLRLLLRGVGALGPQRQCRFDGVDVGDRHAVAVPPQAQRQHGLQHRAAGAVVGSAAQQRAQLLHFVLDLRQRRAGGQRLRPAEQPLAHALAQRAGAVGAAAFVQLQARIVTHRLVERKAGRVAGLGAQQRMRHQGVQRQVRRAAMGGAGGGGGERRCKDRELGQQPLLFGCQQLPAPSDHAPHRRVSRVVAAARAGARQQVQFGGRFTTRQRLHHFLRAEAAHAARGQLDGQRQAAQRPHQGRHCAGLPGAESEVGARSPGAVDEQRHGRRLDGGASCRGRFGCKRLLGAAAVCWRHLGGHVQWLQFDEVLAIQRQHAARCGEHPQGRRQAQQCRDDGDGVVLQLFAVVQHQQAGLRCQRLRQSAAVGSGGGRQMQRRNHGAQQVGLADARHQRHEHHLCQQPSSARRVAPGGFHREACLAGATGPQHRHQPLRVQHGLQLSQHRLGAKKGGQVTRQPHGWRRCFGGVGARARPPRGRGSQRNTGPMAGGGAVLQGVQALALFLHPILVEAGHEFATQRHRLDVQTRSDGSFELVHVAGQRARRDANARPVSLQHGTGPRRAARLEQRLQCRQSLTQAVAADVERHPGPQQFHQLFARVAARRGQRQPRQQQRCGTGRKALQLVAATVRLHRAQQAHAPYGGCGPAAFRTLLNRSAVHRAEDFGPGSVNRLHCRNRP